jgi:hypothetical protein
MTSSTVSEGVGAPRVALTSASVFLVLYLLCALVIANVLVPILVTVAGEGRLGQVGAWLLVPIELAGVLSGATAAYCALRRTARELGELPVPHVAAGIGGPLAVGLVLLALGDPTSDVARSAVDLVVVAGGAAAGAWLAGQVR